MTILAIIIGKVAFFLTRIFGVGGGTTFPGFLAEKIDTNFIKKISDKIKYGVVVVTGTNGKTTTSKMIEEILTEEGYIVIHNSAGSNLSRGIASTLIKHVNFFGTRIDADVAVFEIDEATMPEATTKLRPEVILVTNLFRDQLDRYGELDKTAEIIGSSLRGLVSARVLLNGDDPLVSSLKKYVEGEVVFFGINDEDLKIVGNSAMDSKDCLNCDHELLYKNRYLGHLGSWRCPNCSEKRQDLKYFTSNIDLRPNSSTFVLNLGKESLKIKMPMPGLYNVYNGLAAAAASSVLGVAPPAISHSLHNCEAAFGRMEVINIQDKKVMLLLVKNPTGASQALSAIFSDKKAKKIGLFLNDNFADGTDVSWIWDIDFETFDLNESIFVISGIRAEDMALRLKYAGVEEDKIIINKNLVESVTAITDLLNKGEVAYILPTYTAMIEIRNKFASRNDDLCNMGKVTKKGL